MQEKLAGLYANPKTYSIIFNMRSLRERNSGTFFILEICDSSGIEQPGVCNFLSICDPAGIEQPWLSVYLQTPPSLRLSSQLLYMHQNQYDSIAVLSAILFPQRFGLDTVILQPRITSLFLYVSDVPMWFSGCSIKRKIRIRLIHPELHRLHLAQLFYQRLVHLHPCVL